MTEGIKPMTEPRDTGDILEVAAAEGHDDPSPVEITDPDDPSWVEPARGVTPVSDEEV